MDSLCHVWWILVSAVLVLSCGDTHTRTDAAKRLSHATVVGMSNKPLPVGAAAGIIIIIITNLYSAYYILA